MRNVLYLLIAGVWTALFLAACQDVTGVAYEPEYVVESYQVAGEPLQNVYLGYTAPAEGGEYSSKSHTVAGATVRVSLLAADGTVERVFSYTDKGGGKYAPSEAEKVLAGRRYRLEARTPEGDAISAETLVPQAPGAGVLDRTQVPFEDPNAPRLTVAPPADLDAHTTLLLTNEALVYKPDSLVPAAKAGLPYHSDSWYLGLRIASTSLLNAMQYYDPDARVLRVTLPWSLVSFYGRQRVMLSVLDRNMTDFYRSQGQQTDLTQHSPGEIAPLAEHVEGGTGLFGSYARAVVEYTVTR